MGFIVLVLYAAMAPLESLMWWSRQGQEEIRHTITDSLGPADEASGTPQRRVYLVYLSGRLPGRHRESRREQAVLAAVQEAVPRWWWLPTSSRTRSRTGGC